MVRFWKMENNGYPTWVVALQNAQTGQQRCFSRVEELIHYLQTEFGSGNDQEEASQTAVECKKNSSIS